MQLFQYLLTCFLFDVICYLIDDANFIPKILTGVQRKLEMNNQVSLPLDEDNTKRKISFSFVHMIHIQDVKARLFFSKIIVVSNQKQ